MSKLNGTDSEHEGLEDLPKPLRGPAKTHGRRMVALVYGAGMCSEATATLARKAQARSRPSRRWLPKRRGPGRADCERRRVRADQRRRRRLIS